MPALSFRLAFALAAGLVLCAHLANAPPPPGATFAPVAGNPAVTAQTLHHVLAAPGPACALQPGGNGARVSVLARRPDGVVLSWAGGQAAAAHGCPPGTPLLVSQAAYQALRN